MLKLKEGEELQYADVRVRVLALKGPVACLSFSRGGKSVVLWNMFPELLLHQWHPVDYRAIGPDEQLLLRNRHGGRPFIGFDAVTEDVSEDISEWPARMQSFPEAARAKVTTKLGPVPGWTVAVPPASDDAVTVVLSGASLDRLLAVRSQLETFAVNSVGAEFLGAGSDGRTVDISFRHEETEDFIALLRRRVAECAPSVRVKIS